MRKLLLSLPILFLFALSACTEEIIEARGLLASIDSAQTDTVIVHDTVTVDTCLNNCCDPYKGARVILWQGHSIGDGRDVLSSVVPDSTLFLASKTGLGIEMVTTQTTSNGGDYHSTARNFAIKHKEYFGGSIILVNQCSGGSDVAAFSDKNDWSITGNLWAKSITAARNALAVSKKDSLYAIVIDIGVNDAGANKNYATIKAAYQDLIDRDKAEFPGVQILISQQAKTGATGNLTVTYDLRRLIIEIARENEGVDIAMSDATFLNTIFDQTHLSAAGEDLKGAQLAQWFKNKSLGYSKWANSVLSTQYDELPASKKDAVATFVDSQVSNGNYWKFERLTFFKTSSANNVLVDWSLMGYVLQSRVTVNLNDNMQTTRADAYWHSYVNPSVYTSRSSATNFITGVKVKARASAITANANLFGGGDASAHVGIRQNGTSLSYFANDLTNSTALSSDIGILPGNLYSVYRNGTEKGLIKNTAVAASATVAMTSPANEIIAVSTQRISGNQSFTMLGSYEYYFYAAYDGFDLNSFYNAAETFISTY